jgi:YHS domain-containing protein
MVMKWLASMTLVCGLMTSAVGQTWINVVGSDDRTAISGFDPVAFHTLKKALKGDPRFTLSYAGAQWLFASAEHLQAFTQDPDKFMPAWGGQCAWAVSENGISNKKLSGDFEFVDGRLYLFAYGNSARDGAMRDFLYGRWPRASRIRDGDRHWSDLKRRLEEGSLPQANASNYTRTRFD